MRDEKIKVLLVDDHQLMREGMASLLQLADDVQIVEAVCSGEEALNAADANKPDVILMDIVMKGMSGIEATRWIKEQRRETKVILISMEVTREFIAAGLKSGIDGYVPKDSPKEIMLEAIRTVMEGRQYFAEEVRQIVFDDFCAQRKSDVQKMRASPSSLTRRESEIFHLIVNGLSNKEIGEKLFISAKTVDTHKTNILEKLEVKNTAELVRYAIKHNLLTP